jgi:hypothetical protein
MSIRDPSMLRERQPLSMLSQRSMQTSRIKSDAAIAR